MYVWVFVQQCHFATSRSDADDADDADDNDDNDDDNDDDDGDDENDADDNNYNDDGGDRDCGDDGADGGDGDDDRGLTKMTTKLCATTSATKTKDHSGCGLDGDANHTNSDQSNSKGMGSSDRRSKHVSN